MGFCANCSKGKIEGISVRCSIIEDLSVCVNNNEVVEVEYMLLPLNFGCIEFKVKEDGAEEEIM